MPKDNDKGAKKPGKKTRHTRIVLPGEGGARKTGKAEDPAERFVQGACAQERAETQRGQKDVTAPPQDDYEDEGGFDAPESAGEEPRTAPKRGRKGRNNTIVMPRKNPRVEAVRRKRRWRRVRAVVALVLVAALVLVFASGFYLNVAVAASSWMDTLRIAARGGDGFPMGFAVSGYNHADGMAGNGFAVLAEKDLAIISSAGRELRRVQHSYERPAMSAGNTRVALYGRGGNAYTVEGRLKTEATRTTEQPISFLQMSASGWLAVCTGSRYNAQIAIYEPTLTEPPAFRWSSVTDIPVGLAFHANDRTVAVSCLRAEGGTLKPVVYLFRTNRSAETAELAVITGGEGIPLRMQFTGSVLTVVYSEGYAAQYNTNGEETARYDYAGRTLATSALGGGRAALLFGSDSQDVATLAMLDGALAPVAEAQVTTSASAQVLCAQQGVFYLAGQEVTAFAPDGARVDSTVTEARAYGLVYTKQPLLLTANRAEPLGWLVVPPSEREPASSAPISTAEGTSGPESGAPASGEAPPQSSGDVPKSGSAPVEEGGTSSVPA